METCAGGCWTAGDPHYCAVLSSGPELQNAADAGNFANSCSTQCIKKQKRKKKRMTQPLLFIQPDGITVIKMEVQMGFQTLSFI